MATLLTALKSHFQHFRHDDLLNFLPRRG